MNETAATISLATPNDMALLLALQEKVLGALPVDQHYYIVAKTAARFATYLSTPEDHIYRLSLGAVPAAQLVLRGDVEGFEAARHQAALGHLFAGPLPPYRLIQGALVDPDQRGQHLLRQLLVHVRAELPGLLLARIVPANLPSWISFLQAGFVIAAAASDPDDERQVYYLVQGLSVQAAQEETRCVSQDFASCAALTASGWRGTGYDRATDELIFKR